MNIHEYQAKELLAKYGAPIAAGHAAFTVEEAAELLGLSRAQLYRLIDRGDLKSVTIGRSRRITRNQLDQFIEVLEAKNGRQGLLR